MVLGQISEFLKYWNRIEKIFTFRNETNLRSVREESLRYSTIWLLKKIILVLVIPNH